MNSPKSNGSSSTSAVNIEKMEKLRAGDHWLLMKPDGSFWKGGPEELIKVLAHHAWPKALNPANWVRRPGDPDN
jgi:hypothetical protein